MSRLPVDHVKSVREGVLQALISELSGMPIGTNAADQSSGELLRHLANRQAELVIDELDLYLSAPADYRTPKERIDESSIPRTDPGEYDTRPTRKPSTSPDASGYETPGDGDLFNDRD